LISGWTTKSDCFSSVNPRLKGVICSVNCFVRQKQRERERERERKRESEREKEREKERKREIEPFILDMARKGEHYNCCLFPIPHDQFAFDDRQSNLKLSLVPWQHCKEQRVSWSQPSAQPDSAE
jgi:hypothetical protein